MDTDLIFLVSCFFVSAMIYASVGFGGGSSYLALLGVMGLQVEIIRPAALLCNIVVVAGGTYIFWKSGDLDVKRSLPFLCASIPFAFIGGLWDIGNPSLFFILLGICLIIGSALLWIQPPPQQGYHFNNPVLNALLGAGIGFVSGLVSIGGGIFLSPVLHLVNWGAAKKISALASVFILVNSISGLAGQLSHNHELDWGFIAPLIAAVFVGGQIGSRMGTQKFDAVLIKRITSLVIFVAAIKILKDHL
jgi:hypothetical protein